MKKSIQGNRSIFQRFPNNKLKELPEEIKNIKSLKRLGLNGNLFDDFIPIIMELSSLEILELSHNNITEIPREIIRLGKLKELELDNTPIEYPPWSICEDGINSIKQYFFTIINNLSFDVLTIISKAQKENWRTLDLSWRKLTNLPEEIGGLICLKNLVLRNNELKDLPKSIGELLELQHLDIMANKLEQLPPEIGLLSNIESLNLQSNNLIHLPPEIIKLKKLNHLKIDNNPIKIPPLYICKTGINAIEAFYNYLN